jgi:TPR repeat protein
MKEAFYWLKKAAATGNAPAMDSMGLLYSHEKDIPGTGAKARYWYRRAAASGDATAKKWLERHQH